jgi:hypothetical protein
MSFNVEDQTAEVERVRGVIVRPGRGTEGSKEPLRFIGEAMAAIWDDMRIKDSLQSRLRERQ